MVVRDLRIERGERSAHGGDDVLEPIVGRALIELRAVPGEDCKVRVDAGHDMAGAGRDDRVGRNEPGLRHARKGGRGTGCRRRDAQSAESGGSRSARVIDFVGAGRSARRRQVGGIGQGAPVVFRRLGLGRFANLGERVESNRGGRDRRHGASGAGPRPAKHGRCGRRRRGVLSPAGREDGSGEDRQDGQADCERGGPFHGSSSRRLCGGARAPPTFSCTGRSSVRR